MADNLKIYQKPKSVFTQWWVIAIAMICFVGWYIKASQYGPYVHPQFDAAPYIAPSGCVVKNYEARESISPTCADPKYVFDDWKRYGLEWPGRPGVDNGRQTGTYYRVGNDLIGMQCSFGECNAKGIEKNVFIVSHKVKAIL